MNHFLRTDGTTVYFEDSEQKEKVIEDLNQYFEDCGEVWEPNFDGDGNMMFGESTMAALRVKTWEFDFMFSSKALESYKEDLRGVFPFPEEKITSLHEEEHQGWNEANKVQKKVASLNKIKKGHEERAKSAMFLANKGWDYAEYENVRVVYDSESGVDGKKIFFDDYGQPIRIMDLTETDKRNIKQGGEYQQVHVDFREEEIEDTEVVEIEAAPEQLALPEAENQREDDSQSEEETEENSDIEGEQISDTDEETDTTGSSPEEDQ